MQFKDCKQGYPIYIINRKEVKVDTGKITNSPMPHFDNNFRGATNMVVDINVDVNGKSSTYVLEDSAQVGYVGDIVITLEREYVMRELESIKSQSEDALKMVQYHKDAVAKCDTILKEFSPQYKERAESAERMDSIESKVDKLADVMTKLVERFGGGGSL